MRIDTEHVEDGIPHTLILARDDTGDLGHVKYRTLYECTCIGMVYGLEVREDSRRKGVARALMSAVSDHATANGVSLLLSTVRETNKPSRRLCQRLGFRSLERVKNPRTNHVLRLYALRIGGQTG